MKSKSESKASKGPFRLTRKQRLHDLGLVVEHCFILLADCDYKEICNLTGLSYSTIWRLYTGRFSLKVDAGTVQALCVPPPV